MTRIRIGLVITMLLGSMYAAVGLLDSLFQFGIGLAVAATAFVGYGLCDYLDDWAADEWWRNNNNEGGGTHE